MFAVLVSSMQIILWSLQLVRYAVLVAVHAVLPLLLNFAELRQGLEVSL